MQDINKREVAFAKKSLTVAKEYLKKFFSRHFFHATQSEQMVFAILLGLLLGLIFREDIAPLKILGDILIRMVKMTIIPLIFVSVTYVFCSISDVGKMGKIAIKCMMIYVVTTLVTTLIGIATSVLLKAGVGTTISLDAFGGMANTALATAKGQVTLSNMFVSMFPDNPFVAFVNADVLQVLVFSVFFGIAMNSLSNDVQNIANIFDSMSKIVFRLVDIVTKFTPIGIFGIIAYLAGTQELSTLKSIGSLVVIIYACSLFIVYIFYGGSLLCFGLNPIPFFRKMFAVQYFAFLTSSSSASVPLSKVVSEEKLGVSKSTASLTIPLGAAFNMNGSSLHAGAVTVFFANVAGIDLTMVHYIKIIFLSIMLTLGCAGIPGGPLLRLPILFSSIGIPVEYVMVYLAVDRFIDMILASVNVTGDVFAGVIVDKTQGTFNVEMYNNCHLEKVNAKEIARENSDFKEATLSEITAMHNNKTNEEDFLGDANNNSKNDTNEGRNEVDRSEDGLGKLNIKNIDGKK